MSQPPPVIHVTVVKKGGCAGCMSFIAGAVLFIIVVGGIASIFKH